jgi:hypothetical protein
VLLHRPAKRLRDDQGQKESVTNRLSFFSPLQAVGKSRKRFAGGLRFFEPILQGGEGLPLAPKVFAGKNVSPLPLRTVFTRGLAFAGLKNDVCSFHNFSERFEREMRSSMPIWRYCDSV